MKLITPYLIASSLFRSAVQSNREPHYGIRCAAMIGLAIVIGISSVHPALGQKKPAAFSGATLSPDSSYYLEVANAYKSSRSLSDRNRLIYLAIDQMDLNFYDFQNSTRKKRAFFQTVLDILEIGASTAISITNGTRAKTLIAEGLGAVQAGRTSINKNFALKDTQILFNKMVEKRALVLATILTKSVQTVEQYPFEAALIDLIAYYRAGTFDGALENLNIDTGSAAAAATKAVTALKIKTTADLRKAQTLDELYNGLIVRARNNDAAAITKLKAALTTLATQNIATDLIKTDKVAALTVQELDDLYFDLRVKFMDEDTTTNIQKLADLLK